MVIGALVVALVYYGLWNIVDPSDSYAVPTVLVIAVVSAMVGALAILLL